MIISNYNYNSGLKEINNIRYILHSKFYSNEKYIDELKKIIENNIDCLSIDFAPANYSFTIKIKKTSMKKNSSFKNNPEYYYHDIIRSIFKVFLYENRIDISKYMSSSIMMSNSESSALIANIINSPMLSNLCKISCISDNVIILYL